MSNVTDAIGNLFSGGSSGSSSLGNVLGSFGNILSGIGGAASQTGGVDPNTGQPIDNSGGANAVQSADTSQAATNLINPSQSAQAAITQGQDAPTQNQNQDPQGPRQGQNQDYAPESAVQDLAKALTNLKQQQRQNPWQTGGPNFGPDARQLNRAARIPTGGVPPAPANRADLPSDQASAMEFSNDNPPPPPGYPSIDPADAVRAGLRTNAPDTSFRIPGAPANENAPPTNFNDYLESLRQGAARPASEGPAPAGGPIAGGAGGPPGTPPIDPWGGLAGLARSLGLGPAAVGTAIAMKPSPAETGELPPGGFESRPGTTIAGPASEVLREGEGGPAEDQPQPDPRDPPLGREDKPIDPRTGKPFKVAPRARDKNIDPKTGKPWVLPTKKDGTPDQRYSEPPGPYERGPIMRDVTGGQSIPPLLGEIAQMALPLLIGGLMGGFGGGGGRHGIRGFGMYRRGGFGGGRHFGGGGPFGGHWPYHHPQHGWDLHGDHPGQGWRPMDPRHFRDLMGGRYGNRPLGFAGGQGGGVTGNPQLDQWLSSLGLDGGDGQNQGGGRGGNQVGFGLDNERNQAVANADPWIVPRGGKAGNFLPENAQSGSPDDILSTIRGRESGGRNIAPWRGHSASGYYQIKPETWAAWARDSGDAEAARYQQAYQAPQAVQDRLARWALRRYGPNANYTWAASGPYPSVNPNAWAQEDGRTATGGSMNPNPTGNAPVQVGEAGGLPVYQ